MAVDLTHTYQCVHPVNLYQAPASDSLVTQADRGRYLRLIELPTPAAIALPVQLCEDDYPGWLRVADLPHLQPAPHPYVAPTWTEVDIHSRLGQVIDFVQAAMATPNEYLWGGTIAPNYDCSGLMQAAFAAVGIPIPRDAYQQEAFADPLAISELQPGDLVFFGTPDKATHVGLYLGAGQYIHSSGRDQGRNGIGIDVLSDQGDRVSQTYYRQFRGAGRITRGYVPQSERAARSQL